MWAFALATIAQAAVLHCFAPLYNDALDQKVGRIAADYVFAAFGHVNASCELDFEKPGEKWKLQNLVSDNRNVVVSLGWGKQDIPQIERCPHVFAKSVARFVAQNGLAGFDIDHEDPPFSSEENFVLVSTELRKALPKPLLLTITPASLYSVDIPTVNAMYDFVNAQTYWSSAQPFLDAGLLAHKVLAGVNIESGESFEQAVEQVKRLGLAGAFVWTFALNETATIANMQRALA